jgi:hypothetical protein
LDFKPNIATINTIEYIMKPNTQAGTPIIGPVLTPQLIKPVLQLPKNNSRYDKNPEKRIPAKDMIAIYFKEFVLSTSLV